MGYKSESLVTKSFNEVYIGNRENGVIGSLSLGAAIDTVSKIHLLKVDLKVHQIHRICYKWKRFLCSSKR